MAYYGREGAIWDGHRLEEGPPQRVVRDRQFLVQPTITVYDSTHAWPVRLTLLLYRKWPRRRT
jgi:hypothetical protein